MNRMLPDPSMMTNMIKGQALNYVPMVVLMSLISWAFSGFVISKLNSTTVPCPMYVPKTQTKQKKSCTMEPLPPH